MRWVFFDIGWTLVDETEAHRVRFAGLSSMLEEVGVALSWPQFERACTSAASAFAEMAD